MRFGSWLLSAGGAVFFFLFFSIVIFGEMDTDATDDVVQQAHVYGVSEGDCVKLTDQEVYVVQGNQSLHIYTAEPGEWDCTKAQAIAQHDQNQREGAT